MSDKHNFPSKCCIVGLLKVQGNHLLLVLELILERDELLGEMSNADLVWGTHTLGDCNGAGHDKNAVRESVLSGDETVESQYGRTEHEIRNSTGNNTKRGPTVMGAGLCGAGAQPAPETETVATKSPPPATVTKVWN